MPIDLKNPLSGCSSARLKQTAFDAWRHSLARRKHVVARIVGKHRVQRMTGASGAAFLGWTLKVSSCPVRSFQFQILHVLFRQSIHKLT